MMPVQFQGSGSISWRCFCLNAPSLLPEAFTNAVQGSSWVALTATKANQAKILR
jgi:hypothetical protein